MDHDVREKTAQYIDNCVKIRETFQFAHPKEQIFATEKYCTAIYGSSLWMLDGDMTSSLYSAWKTNIKLSCGVHRGCRTYFLQNVLTDDDTSLRTRLISRFLGFFQNLLNSPSQEVSVAARLGARDLRSSLGSNLELSCCPELESSFCFHYFCLFSLVLLCLGTEPR